MILADEQIFRDSSWYVTMSYPCYDSHVRYHNQQNIVPLQKLCTINDNDATPATNPLLK